MKNDSRFDRGGLPPSPRQEQTPLRILFGEKKWMAKEAKAIVPTWSRNNV